MKTFYLRRDFTDEVKQRIAEGVFFSNGTGVIQWHQQLNRTFFYSETELRRALDKMSGVELVYAFQTRVENHPKEDFAKTSVTVSVNGKPITQYITDQVLDHLDRTIASGGTL